jgi:diacylglycerol O-acyltransferase / wax synthase
MAAPEKTAREVRSDPRMTDLEALMWNLDKDPHLTSVFANVTVLDCAPDREYLRRKLGRAVQEIPRLRQRVVPAFGRLAPPTWEEDPTFDLDYHLRWTALAGKRDERALLELATRIHQQPFDRVRPLWEFVVVEGLRDGRAAMVQKLHHTVTDGVGGLRLAERFLDLERSPAELDAAPPVNPRASGIPGPTFVGRALGTAAHIGRQAATTSTEVAKGAGNALLHPDRWPLLALEAGETVRSVVRQVVGTNTARSPLWTDRSLWRELVVLRVDFDTVKEAASRQGVTMNDLFVTAAARAAGEVHRRSGQPVTELRMAMPMSTRDDKSAAGNAFSLTRSLIPVDIDEPKEHLQAVHELLATTRGEKAFQVLDQLAGLMNVLPTSTLVAAARHQAETVDFTTSNLRGAPFPLFFGGAQIVENYPVGPLAGTAFNLTMLSYAGELHLGLLADTAAIPDPDALRDALRGAFEDLTA